MRALLNECQDLPTLEQLEISHRMEYYDAWLCMVHQWLADAVKKNTEPAMFKAHYNVLVTSITLVISGDIACIQQQSKRFKKLCKNLHQAYKPNSIAIIDSYTKAAKKYGSVLAVCEKLRGITYHDAVSFFDQGGIIRCMVDIDPKDVSKLNIGHPDGPHWYVNANFIEVADMLLQHSGAGHTTNAQ